MMKLIRKMSWQPIAFLVLSSASFAQEQVEPIKEQSGDKVIISKEEYLNLLDKEQFHDRILSVPPPSPSIQNHTMDVYKPNGENITDHPLPKLPTFCNVFPEKEECKQ